MTSSLTNVAETYNNPNWEKMIAVESVQELALNKPDDIPQRYIRPHDDRPSSTFSHDITTIPLIDMKKLFLPSESNERQQEMDTLSKSCQDWGFFQVVNHGIPHSLIDRIRGVANEFFSLPLDEKQRYAPQAGAGFFQGYGKNFVVDEDQILDWNDLLYLTIMPQKLIKFTLWPTTLLDYRDTVERYRTEVERVAQVLLSLFAENLQLKSDYFKDKFGDDPMMTMGMNLYPPCPRPDLVLGVSPHSDGSGITLLVQDDQTEGLQILKSNQWISVQPIPYAFVVNIGDLVEVMTNGRYKSIEHRVVTNKEKTRSSIAVFYSPGLDEEVAPASSLVDEQHPLLYRKFKHHEFMNDYHTKRSNGKQILAGFTSIEDTHPDETH